MDVRFDTNHRAPASGEEAHTIPGTKRGVPLVSRQFRFIVAIVPDPGLLTNGDTDGLMVTANANVTLTSADDPAATPFVVALLAGVQYDLSVAKVTAVSAGTAYALYHRKP